jgi:hypothetical protein
VRGRAVWYLHSWPNVVRKRISEGIPRNSQQISITNKEKLSLDVKWKNSIKMDIQNRMRKCEVNKSVESKGF